MSQSSTISSLPVLSGDQGLARYLADIRQFPVLTADEEYTLAKAWKEEGDRAAAHKLVTSHLRLVAKIAMGYRGYGLPVADLIAEGNVGMMQAVKRFDHEKGFRLATYAMWWIKASIQEYILHSWSLVKIGTTAAQKKLFFNLRRIKNDINAIERGDLAPDQVDHIAESLNVSSREVIDMNRRLAGHDHSLNAPLSVANEESGEWQDWLIDDKADQEREVGDMQEMQRQQALMRDAMAVLTPRERHILAERRLREPATTLEDLSQHYKISRERVRQIELRALEKIREAITSKAKKAMKALPAAE